MKNCKKSGKSQGILKWRINGNPEFKDRPGTSFHRILVISALLITYLAAQTRVGLGDNYEIMSDYTGL